MQPDVIFIGGVGNNHEYGGELSKNKLILKRLKDEGFKIKVIDTFRSHQNPFKIAKLPFVLVRHLSTPVIFSTSYGNIRLLSKLVRMLNPKRRIILWVIGGRLGIDFEGGKYTVTELQVFDHMIVESPIMVEQLKNSGVARIEYVPNFKDNKLSCISTSKHNSLANGLKCIFFSRIQQDKGVEIILDAMEKVEKSGLNISVDFYGEIMPDFKENFINRINNLSNVRYCGTLNFFDGSGQKKLSEYHLSLFPTFWRGEGFPGVIVDAFMAGVPVLASDWNFNPEIVVEGTGFITRSKDVEDFTKWLFEVYDHRLSFSDYFERCIVEGRKYDVNTILTGSYLKKLIRP